MYNLFEPTTAAEVISRIEKLQPTSKALWGKMDVAQMLRPFVVPLWKFTLAKKKQKEV